MQISDVIADMLTRIRNANNAKHETVDVPASGVKKAIADILVEEGYSIAKPYLKFCKILRKLLNKIRYTVCYSRDNGNYKNRNKSRNSKV